MITSLLYFGFWISFLLGISFLVVAILRFRIIRSRDWETVEGRVVSVETCDYADEVGMVYELIVTYVYEAQDVERQSQYDGSYGAESHRDDDQSAYKADQRIIVHFDPSDPDITWIRKSEIKEPRQSLVLGFISIAIAIIIFLSLRIVDG